MSHLEPVARGEIVAGIVRNDENKALYTLREQFECDSYLAMSEFFTTMADAVRRGLSYESILKSEEVGAVRRKEHMSRAKFAACSELFRVSLMEELNLFGYHVTVREGWQVVILPVEDDD